MYMYDIVNKMIELNTCPTQVIILKRIQYLLSLKIVTCFQEHSFVH